MNLLEPSDSPPIAGVEIPREFYWVLGSPTPLAGMKYPRTGFPWLALHHAGFADVVSLHPGGYNAQPLRIVFSQQLQDLVDGAPPNDAATETALIKGAVETTLASLLARRGVVIHCMGGRGRTGTVLGCVLRELGFGGQEVVSYLNDVHKARGKPGWPESQWQGSLVHGWKPAV